MSKRYFTPKLFAFLKDLSENNDRDWFKAHQDAYEEYLALSRKTDYKLGEAIAFANLGTVAMYRGMPEQARALYAESLMLTRELGDKKYSAMHLAAIAGPVAAGGHPQAAARLLGASEALLEALGIVRHASDWPDTDRHMAAVREQLDDATFDAAWAEGRAMSFEQAVSYALEVGQLVPAEHPPGPVREPEVAVELSAFLEGEEDKVPRPVFVARERELAQLDGHLDQALSGQGRVVLVTGEAGQGKTALVQEFARRAQAAHPDLIVASGYGNAYTGVGDPYLPFREILAMLEDPQRTESLAEIFGAIHRGLRRDANRAAAAGRAGAGDGQRRSSEDGPLLRHPRDVRRAVVGRQGGGRPGQGLYPPERI